MRLTERYGQGGDRMKDSEAYQKLLSQIHKVVREPKPDEQNIQEQRVPLKRKREGGR